MAQPIPELEQKMLAWGAEAAEVARSRFRHTGPLQFKYAREAVTEADREIEKLIGKRIRAQFPSDAIFGEEYGVSEAHGSEQQRPERQGPGANQPTGRAKAMAGRVWYVDPIDGTLIGGQDVGFMRPVRHLDGPHGRDVLVPQKGDLPQVLDHVANRSGRAEPGNFQHITFRHQPAAQAVPPQHYRRSIGVDDLLSLGFKERMTCLA